MTVNLHFYPLALRAEVHAVYGRSPAGISWFLTVESPIKELDPTWKSRTDLDTGPADKGSEHGVMVWHGVQRAHHCRQRHEYIAADCEIVKSYVCESPSLHPAIFGRSDYFAYTDTCVNSHLLTYVPLPLTTSRHRKSLIRQGCHKCIPTQRALHCDHVCRPHWPSTSILGIFVVFIDAPRLPLTVISCSIRQRSQRALVITEYSRSYISVHIWLYWIAYPSEWVSFALLLRWQRNVLCNVGKGSPQLATTTTHVLCEPRHRTKA